MSVKNECKRISVFVLKSINLFCSPDISTEKICLPKFGQYGRHFETLHIKPDYTFFAAQSNYATLSVDTLRIQELHHALMVLKSKSNYEKLTTGILNI